MTTATIPRAFVWRRLHSLTGLWLVLFLMEHLLTNSQAALLLGENGQGFVKMVNALHNFPYLQAIEIFLLGVPILVHMIWGVQYLFTAKPNSYGSNRAKPALPEYGRNRAYTWQRITSWILLFMLAFHVVKFRFLEYPVSVSQGAKSSYMVRISLDTGLYTVADRLGVRLYDQTAIEKEKRNLEDRSGESALVDAAHTIQSEENLVYDAQKAVILASAQKFEEKTAFVNALQKQTLSQREVVAVADNFGTASLLVVRNTFKNPFYVGFYTVFVLAACFHAFNGFWTFLISWGIILKMSAQRSMATFAIALMLIVTFLGLAAVWGTYWINLRY